jgi:hypothetical protein
MAKKDNVTQLKKDAPRDTKCFTFEVAMLIQVLAEHEGVARDQLDTQGGYITDRRVKLIDSVELYNGNKKEGN